MNDFISFYSMYSFIYCLVSVASLSLWLGVCSLASYCCYWDLEAMGRTRDDIESRRDFSRAVIVWSSLTSLA